MGSHFVGSKIIIDVAWNKSVHELLYLLFIGGSNPAHVGKVFLPISYRFHIFAWSTWHKANSML